MPVDEPLLLDELLAPEEPLPLDELLAPEKPLPLDELLALDEPPTGPELFPVPELLTPELLVEPELDPAGCPGLVEPDVLEPPHPSRRTARSGIAAVVLGTM